MDALFWLYWTSVLSTLACAWVWGGWPERAGAVMVLAASALNLLLTGDLRVGFLSVNWPLFIVDFALFAALLGLSIKADRWWTFVACGAQLIAVLGHLVKLLGQMISAFSYGFLNTLWSYVVLAAILVGVIAQRRRAVNAASRSSRTLSDR